MEKKLRYGETLSCGCLYRGRASDERAGDACQKTDCMYHSSSGCTYFIVTGQTRLFTHIKENININNPCREYSPGEKALACIRPFTLGNDYR
jgi:hypothetical protein